MAEQHAHQHDHHHHHDYEKANADLFTEYAKTYRTEFSCEIAKRCASYILQKYPFDSSKTEVLDYACGPGLVAFELLPHTKRIVGADLAPGMVDVFNQSVEHQGISSDKLHCVHTDALQSCIQAYHHFKDPTDITRALSQRLKSKGRLMIIDFIDDNETNKVFQQLQHEAHSDIVAHRHGFSSEQMINMFKAADLQNPQVEKAFQMSKSEMKTYQGHEVFGKAMNSDIDFTLNYFIAYADKA
ncbi:unnamed protein product [Adineta steineri]|uniref:Methyltransferase domain-containing protein n=2 Tax=Adineta steineri TaxID=433720 RepID=A0A815IYL5_9BILA|nr:unnamed protein product [Adineta steineri]CAF3988305.1 unnamed protein product [Adineta steineri]